MSTLLINGWWHANVSYDSDAEAYMNRVEATGVTLTSLEKGYIDTFVLGLKSNSLWTKIYDAGMFIGGTANSHAETLKGINDITWNGGVTHSSTGSVGNGTSGYGSIGIVPSSVLTLNDTHAGFYSRTNNNTGVGDIGCQTSTTSRITLFPRSSTNFISDHYTNTNGRITASNAASTGFYITTRISSTDYRGSKNGSQIGTTNTTTSDGTLPNIAMTIMGVNNSGTVSTFSTRELCYWSVGSGLSMSECSTYYTLVNNLQTSLGRNV